MTQNSYRPSGRLVPIFAASDGLPQGTLSLSLSKLAASRGETVLMLDALGGDLMKEAGIIFNKTLGDVLYRGADIRDVKYVTSNEHFTACACGDAPMDMVLGSLAALSLSYDWVFVATPAGCTPAHIRLAAAADVGILAYDTHADNFMRAYWMMEAIRARAPKFDPLILATGHAADAHDTASMLSHTLKSFLGAPPPYAGHISDKNIHSQLLNKARQVSERTAVA
jgi:MinD-like ATPase involved in chromosome partitioning or flagellar assembly